MTTTSMSALIGGSGAWAVRLIRHVTGSETVVAPVTGKLLVMLLAPGGSGAVVNSALSDTTIRLATGAGGGEYVTDVIDVIKNDSYVLTMGAPGAAVTGITPGIGIGLGNDAGTVTLTGPNAYSCTAVGGKGGSASVGSSNRGGGGGGSGGGTARVMRFAGGRGGSIQDANTNARIATGGGAPNPFGLTAQTSTRGGDSTTTATAHSTSTGGGSVGGRGGDASGTGGTAGGGSGGSASGTTRGPNINGIDTTASPTDIVALLATFGIDIYGGGAASASENSGPGGGLFGAMAATARQAGNMGGAAGVVGTAGVSANLPGIGAGSGGFSANTNSSAAASSAPGGVGRAVFIFLSQVV